jgi:hypothetical protein
MNQQPSVFVSRAVRVRLDDPKQLRVAGVSFEDAKWFATLPSRMLKRKALMTQRGQALAKTVASFFQQSTIHFGASRDRSVVMTIT